MWKNIFVSIAAVAFISGCAGSKVTKISVKNKGPQQEIKSLAMAPSGGLLADAVSVELSNDGINVIDGSTTSNMMVRLNITEVEIISPQSLAKFKQQGIDAILSVKAAGSYDGQPESASARINSTEDGRLLAGVTWQNGFGGRAGSIADRMMRSGLNETAKNIADALIKQLGMKAERK